MEPDIRDIRSLYLVQMVYRKASNQIRIYIMPWCRFTQVWLRIYCLQDHFTHKTIHALPVDPVIPSSQRFRYLPVTVNRAPLVFFKNQELVILVFIILNWLIIH